MSTLMNGIKRAFNRASATYDEYCQLQIMTGNTLLSYLSTYISTPTSIIDIGCGTGINTEQLLERFPQSHLTCLDFADQLLQLAALRLAKNNVRLIESDFDNWNESITYDVIYSNLALQWSNNFPFLLNKLITLLNPHGVLAFSIPLPGTLNKVAKKLNVRTFYSAKEVVAFAPNALFLLNKKERITQQHRDSFSALKSIKAVGANFVSTHLKKGLCGKTFINSLELSELTYDIGYFIIKKHDLHVER